MRNCGDLYPMSYTGDVASISILNGPTKDKLKTIEPSLAPDGARSRRIRGKKQQGSQRVLGATLLLCHLPLLTLVVLVLHFPAKRKKQCGVAFLAFPLPGRGATAPPPRVILRSLRQTEVLAKVWP